MSGLDPFIHLSGESGYLANHGYDQDFFTGLGITTGAAFATPSAMIENRATYGYYNYKANSLDVSTAPNSALFYSGDGARAVAQDFANLNNKTTLEMTSGGSWLDQKDLFNNNGNSSVLKESQAEVIWSKLSQRYAQGASGEVTSFINNPRANSIFNTIEYPALLKNSNVTNISVLPGAK